MSKNKFNKRYIYYNSLDDYKMTFEQGSKQTREVKISPANTDLLFKLFENIEQKERKLQQIQLPIQRKLK